VPVIEKSADFFCEIDSFLFLHSIKSESVLKKRKSFLVQQFLENAAEVKGEQPLSLPAGSETPQ
jgi:hypothetical protein